jgi:hypothetical protein
MSTMSTMSTMSRGAGGLMRYEAARRESRAFMELVASSNDEGVCWRVWLF